MKIEDLVQLKDRFVTRKIGEEMVLVPLESNVANMDEIFSMNSTACFIWECIDDQTTFDDVLQRIQDEFDVPHQLAEKDLHTFLKDLESLYPKK